MRSGPNVCISDVRMHTVGGLREAVAGVLAGCIDVVTSDERGLVL